MFAGTLLVWWIECRYSFIGLEYPDAVDYAQLARELVRGHGYRSMQSFPFVLGWLAQHGLPTEPPWPNVTRFPLPVLTRAAAFATLGVSESAAVLPGALYHAATASALFLLGRRLFGTWTGVLAAGIHATAPATLYYAIAGLTETGATFWVAAAALTLSWAGDPGRRRVRTAFLLGTVVGLGFLQRSNLALALPVAALLLGLGPERRGRGAIAALLVGFATPVLPWFLWKAAAYGAPLVDLTSDRGLVRAVTGSDPFFSFQQYDPWALVAEHPARLVRALRPAWWWRHGLDLFGPGFGWVGPVFLGLGFLRLGPRVRSVQMLALGGLLGTYLLLAWIYPEVVRFYVPWTPPFLVVAVGSAVEALRRLTSLTRAAIPVLGTAVLAITILPIAHKAVGAPLRLPDEVAEMERGKRELAQAVRRRVPFGALVASDVSWHVAWAGDRPSVRFYGDIAQLARIERAVAPVAAVILQSPASERFRTDLARSALAGRFREVQRFPGPITLWIRTGGEGG